jgi:predicted outer membrane repeat protein
MEKNYRSIFFMVLGIFTFLAATAEVVYVKPGATSGAWQGKSPVYSSLQEALSNAVSGDQLWVAAGVYHPTTGTDRNISFLLKEGVQMYGGFSGTENALTDRNHALNITILSGNIGDSMTNADNTSSVVKAIGTSGTPITTATVIDGFIIEDGNALNFDSGAGLYLDYASPLIQNVWLRDNYGAMGGAVHGTATSAATFANVLFTGNVSYSVGGGVYADGAMNFYHCLWYGNSSSTAEAAATFTSASASIFNSIVWGNTQPTGSSVSGASIFYSIIEGGHFGEGNLDLDPLFHAADYYDFRLSPGSPAAESGSNAATPVWLTTDYLNATRIQGTVERGPFEGTVQSPEISTPLDATVFEAGTSSVDLGWGWTGGEPAGNESYEIEYKVNGVLQPVIDGVTEMAMVLSMSGSGSIEWRVAGVDVLGQRSWSDWSVFYIQRSGPVYVKYNGAGSGQSWADATNLQSALNNYITGDELWLMQGTYKPTTGTNRNVAFVLKEGIQIYGGFAGSETAREQRDWYNNRTFLSGNIGSLSDNTDNSRNVLIADGTTENPITTATIVDGVVIEKGYHSEDTGYGAGVKLTNASVTFANVWFRDNYAYNGGAVYGNGNASPEFFNTIFSNNASMRYGGAVRAEKRMVFTNCVFYGNSTGDRGGAVDNASTTTFVAINNSIAWGNTAPSNPQFYAVDARHSLAEGGYPGINMLLDDPLFLNAGSNDFRINQASPCMDAGSIGLLPTGTLKDFAGLARVQGLQVDLGVFEGGKPTPFPVSPANNAVVSPLETDLTFEWEWLVAIPGEVASYRLEFTVNGGPLSMVSGIEATQLSQLVTGFSPADKVTWRIAVLTDEGATYYSPFSVFYIGRGQAVFVKEGATGSGESWADAAGLQAALQAAVFGDELWIAAGVYKPTSGADRAIAFEVKDGVRLYGGFSGSETALSQRDPVNYPTILSGNIGDPAVATDNSFHVVKMVGPVSAPLSHATVLDGLTIENGYANLNINTNGDGGGLYLNHASPTITNVTFAANYAINGGAVSVLGNSAPRLGNVLFYGNTSDKNGGALYTDADGTFYNCVWYDNYSGQWGGAVYATTNNPTTIANAIFRNNEALLLSDHFRNVNVSYSLVEDGTGTGSLSDDPLFVDEAGYDFRLNHASPALDAGSEAMPAWLLVDFTNNSRTLGDRTDIGLFEGGTDTPTPLTPADGTAITLEEGKATLEWGWPGVVPVDVSNYSLTYRINEGEEVLVDNITGLSYEIEGLTFPDKVWWRLYSEHNDGSHRWSAPAQFRVSRGHPLYVTPAGIGNGTSWADATSLHEALFMAVEMDELWLAGGTYFPAGGTDRTATFELVDGIRVYGGFAGTETTLAQRNWVQNKTIISGDIGMANDAADNSYHLLTVKGTSAFPVKDLLIDGLVVENGNAASVGGGGLLLEYASPVILNTWFRNHETAASGGAVLADAASEAVFGNVIFTNNTAGANGGAVNAPGALHFYNCLWHGNTAGYFGGAVLAQEAFAYNSIAWNNSANSGQSFFGTKVMNSIVEGGYTGTGNMNTDPSFVSPTTMDFRLRKGSPALDAGEADYLPEWLVLDFNGQARVSGNDLDLGPFEGSVEVDLVAPVAAYPANGTEFSTDITSVTVEWQWDITPPTGIIGYEMEYRINEGAFQVITGISLMRQAIINLAPADAIRWRVRTITSDGVLDWSESYAFSILNPIGLPDTDIIDHQLQVWPNPVEQGVSVIHVEIPDLIPEGSILVFDLAGRIMLERGFQSATRVDIDVNRFLAGAYLIRIKDAHGRYWTRKVIVK